MIPGRVPPRDAEVQHKLETLRQEYNVLHTKKITTDANIKNLEENLDRLRASAEQEYGTSDLEKLKREIFETRRRENEEKVAQYEQHVRELKEKLAAIEGLIRGSLMSPADSGPASRTSGRRKFAGTLRFCGRRRQIASRPARPGGKTAAGAYGVFAVGSWGCRSSVCSVPASLRRYPDRSGTEFDLCAQEVLEQDLKVVSTTEVKKGKATISFGVERDGHREDILTGQGGSVCNIISVGLRLIALSQLPDREHRRFLILDEQDCWLKPDLVPRLMAIIHTIAEKLNFQLLVISHHDINLFREYADRIYRLAPAAKPGDGVRLELGEGGAIGLSFEFRVPRSAVFRTPVFRLT